MDRRVLLKLAAAAPLVTLSFAPVLAASRRQVKVAAVEAFAVPRAIFVKVTADDGSFGWGEAGHSGGRAVARMVRDEFAALAKGADVFDLDATWARIYYEIDELGPGGIASQALAGVDCALWDLRGRLLGQPVWALLGGKFRSRFPLYGSFSRDAGDGKFLTPDECATRAEALVAEGFKAVKVRLAIREENADPDPDPAIPTVAAVRKRIGDKIALYVDANNGYRAARAIQVGRRLYENFGVSVFEEPVAAYQYAVMAQVKDALDMEIAAGEHEYTRWAFRDLIVQGKPDVLNPDVSKMCGLTDARRVAVLAELFDKSISVHNARPTLLTAAHAHFVAGAQMANRPQEHPGARRLNELWRFFKNRLVPEADGTFVVPDTPGLGLEVDEAAVRAAAA
jgi:L-alanine-DL-glutamate epimerase-like enolase superfamily enzyme